MGTSHDFTLADLKNDSTFSIAVGRNQVNVTPSGTTMPLRTTGATDKDPQRSISTWSASDILQGAATLKDKGATLDVFNQSLSAELTDILRTEEGGVSHLLGNSAAYAPYDIVLAAMNNKKDATNSVNAIVSGATDSTGSVSFGAPPPKGTYRSTTEMRGIWGNVCATSKDLVRIPLWSGGAAISVRKECEELFVMIDSIMKKHNYTLRKADTGAFNCRRITGGSGWSLHAFGIAADYNWTTNPYGKRLITDMPPAMVTEIKQIKSKKSSLLAVRWGGDYERNKDAMHFECVLSPAELAGGLSRY